MYFWKDFLNIVNILETIGNNNSSKFRSKTEPIYRAEAWTYYWLEFRTENIKLNWLIVLNRYLN